MRRIVKAEPMEDHWVRLEFSDGVGGEVDLSGLVGKGIFKALEDVSFFISVFIDSETRAFT